MLNADLIESIESSPDTVITLANGRRMVVTDRPQDIVDRISMFRASILAAAEDILDAPKAEVVQLRAEPGKGA
jgi:flagellar protein FlbD